MRRQQTVSRLFLTMLAMIALPASIFAYTSAELRQYKEKELIAPDFTLKGLDGKTYKLSDYRKKIVVMEAGSST